MIYLELLEPRIRILNDFAVGNLQLPSWALGLFSRKKKEDQLKDFLRSQQLKYHQTFKSGFNRC
jgi:hypothetical protein